MSTPPPPWLVEALPEDARAEVRVLERAHGRLALRFGGGEVIDVQLARETPRAFVTHGALSFGYRVDEGSASERGNEEARQLCEDVAEALAARVGEQLRDYLDAPNEAAARPEFDSPRATMMLTEGDVLRGRSLAALADALEVESVELYLHGAVCVQRCHFCAYPRVRARRGSPLDRLGAGLRVVGQRATGSPDVLDWLRRVVEIMRRRPRGRVILSGPDCLRHPQIDAILELLAGAPELGVELLGPLTRLAEPDVAARVAAIPGLRSICTSLLSTRAATHDAMVGTLGAHAQVLSALANCRAHQIPVTINVLVTPANVDDLAELLPLCLELGATNVNVSLYHPESASEVLVRASWRELELTDLVVEREALLRAWATTPREVLDHVHAHYLPRCWVPDELRELLLRSPRDVQDNFTHPPGCAACRERTRCPGVTVPAAELLGAAAVRALS